MDVSHLKIGHLPERIQGMVNDHLDNRENPAKVVAWLNEFGPVQLMLAKDFNHSRSPKRIWRSGANSTNADRKSRDGDDKVTR